MRIAPSLGGNTDIEKMSTFIYKINFSCLASDILEADRCFAKESGLVFDKNKAPHLSPLISVEIQSPPKHPDIVLSSDRRGQP